MRRERYDARAEEPAPNRIVRLSMMRVAERIHTGPDAIERLRAVIAQLPDGARVSLELEDGHRLDGVVAVRPVLQVFLDRTGREGLNAIVRIEETGWETPEIAQFWDVWIDRIREVRAQPQAPRLGVHRI